MTTTKRPQPTAPGPAARAALGSAVALLLLHLVVCGWAALAARSPTLLSVEQLQLRLDPNVATAAELELLPGIGPRLAQAIIDYRQSAGMTVAFHTPEDLDRVPHIGPVTVERLRPYLRFTASSMSVVVSDAP